MIYAWPMNGVYFTFPTSKCSILNYKRNPSVTFLGNYGKIIRKWKCMLHHILKLSIMHQNIEYRCSFTLTRWCCTPRYRQGVISENDKFETIGFHSSPRINQFTSSNNRYVPLWRGHRACVEAKTNRDSLVSPDLNPIEQLWDDLLQCIRDRSVQPWNFRQLHVALH